MVIFRTITEPLHGSSIAVEGRGWGCFFEKHLQTCFLAHPFTFTCPRWCRNCLSTSATLGAFKDVQRWPCFSPPHQTLSSQRLRQSGIGGAAEAHRHGSRGHAWRWTAEPDDSPSSARTTGHGKQHVLTGLAWELNWAASKQPG